MTKRLPRLHPSWRRVGFALQPSPGECRAMVEQLQQLLGRHGLCAALGVPWRTILGWLGGKMPSAGAVRAIWLTWCLILHPERLSSLHDIVTWGRFRIERGVASHGEASGEWSGWVI